MFHFAPKRTHQPKTQQRCTLTRNLGKRPKRASRGVISLFCDQEMDHTILKWMLVKYPICYRQYSSSGKISFFISSEVCCTNDAWFPTSWHVNARELLRFEGLSGRLFMLAEFCIKHWKTELVFLFFYLFIYLGSDHSAVEQAAFTGKLSYIPTYLLPKWVVFVPHKA